MNEVVTGGEHHSSLDEAGNKKKSTTLTPGSDLEVNESDNVLGPFSKQRIPKLHLALNKPRLKIVSDRSSRKNSDHSKSRELSQNKSEDDVSGFNKSKLEAIHSKLDANLILHGSLRKFGKLKILPDLTDPIVKKESMPENGSPGSMHYSAFKSPISFNGNGSLSPGKFAVHDGSKSKDEVKAIILNSFRMKEREGSSSLSGSENYLSHFGPKRTNFNLEELVQREGVESSKISNPSTNRIQGKAFFPNALPIKEDQEYEIDTHHNDLDEAVVINKISAKFISPQYSPPEDHKSYFKSITLGRDPKETQIKPHHNIFAENRDQIGDSESDLNSATVKTKRRKSRMARSRKVSDNRNTIYGVAGNSVPRLPLPYASPEPPMSNSPNVQPSEKSKNLGATLAQLYGRAYPTQVTYVSFTGDNHLLARVDTSNGNLLAIYQGDLKDGLPSGHGTLKYSALEFYHGMWEGGLAHGQGELVTECYTYIGNFRDGIFSGIGTLTIKEKGAYQGNFSEGKFHGQGKFSWSGQKKIYLGTWKHGLFHGKGLMVWPDGRKFYGEYQKGLKHGKGLCVFASGLHKYGQWFKGTLVQSEG